VRVGLGAAIVLFCGLTAWRASTLDERAEQVWDEKAVEWQRTPVRVWVDRAAFKDYQDAIDQAVKTWNGRLGFTFFEFTNDRASADVVIRPSDGTPCGDDGGRDGKAAASACLLVTHVDIQVRRIDEIGQAHRVFVHELGHAIGLDHDEFGAMAPTALEPKIGDFPEYLLPSNKDIAAIRAKYGPR